MRRELMLTLLFCFLICCNIIGQHVHKNGNPAKLYLAGFSLGCDFAGNKELDNWLEMNGVSSGTKLNYACQVSGLAPIGKYLMGFGLGTSLSNKPNLSNVHFVLLFGKALKRGKVYCVPLLGIGVNSSVINFKDTIPSPLATLKPSGRYLFENSLYIIPQVRILMKTSPAFNVGVELGCKILDYPSNWHYGLKDGGGRAPVVPNSSIFHPYISIFFGYGL